MSVLVVGVSHKTAPVTLLERLALDGDGVHKLLTEAVSADHVTEAAVLATCNRLEIRLTPRWSCSTMLLRYLILRMAIAVPCSAL